MFNYFYDMTRLFVLYWFDYFHTKVQLLNLYSGLERIDANTYILNYTLNGTDYSTVIKIKRGPCTFTHVYDENNNEVTHLIKRYYGPGKDFHHYPMTPSFWGKEKLTFVMDDIDEIRVFNGNEMINI